MGTLYSKIVLENDAQIKWRKVTSKRSPQSTGMMASNNYYFEELHFLRGGKERISVCPSLFWPDRYSLIDYADNLLPFLHNQISCSAIIIWNFNRRNLHDTSLTEKDYGTQYERVFPDLLSKLLMKCTALNPKILQFTQCDFSNVPRKMLQQLILSQAHCLEEVIFDNCESLPLPEEVFEQEERPFASSSSAPPSHVRKLSISTVDCFKESPTTTTIGGDAMMVECGSAPF